MLYAKGLLALGFRCGDLFCSFGAEGPEATILFIACSSIGVKFTAPYLYTPVKRSIDDIIDEVFYYALCILFSMMN